MELAKKLIMQHPDLTLKQAFEIEEKRQEARKRRNEEPKIDASIHMRIDQEMNEYYMMKGNEDEIDKENSVIPNEDYQIGISVKMNQMDLSNGEGPRDMVRTTN